ncbi:MAG: helix-turn-helix domain-containing protein [Methylocella sp.]
MKQELTLEPVLVTPQQATGLLGICLTRVYVALKKGELETRYIGSSRRIPMASIRAFADNLPRESHHGKHPELRGARVSTGDDGIMNQRNGGSGTSPPTHRGVK